MTIDDIQIKIFLARAKSDTVAYAKLTFPVEIDGAPAPTSVSSFRIMNSHYGGKSFIVRPPAIKAGDGTYKDVFFLNNKECWYRLEQRILEEYDQIIRKEMQSDAEATS